MHRREFCLMMSFCGTRMRRTSDVVNVLWSVAGVHMKYDYFLFLSIAGSLVKCGVVVVEIYVYFHVLCLVIC